MSAEASYANFFLRLVGSTLEFGLRRQEEVTVHQRQLDQVLGNNEGSFDVGGVNFSQSAKNIQLDGTVLHADLRTSAGIWHPDHLQIIIAIDDTDPTKRSLSVVLRPYTSRLRLLSTRNGPLLLASCGKGEESCVDLGAYLGNRDGAFDPAGQAFHNSAEAITLVGSALHARLRHVDGTWQACSIGLEDILHLDSSSGLGVLLQPRRQPRRREAHYIVLRDQGQRNWLANARDIFLLNRDDEQRRQWILVAQCGGGHTDGSFFRQTQFYLDDVLGVDYNMIFAPSFLYPQENRGVRAVHLHDGVLTATFNCGGVQDFTRPVWERRSIDLGSEEKEVTFIIRHLCRLSRPLPSRRPVRPARPTPRTNRLPLSGQHKGQLCAMPVDVSDSLCARLSRSCQGTVGRSRPERHAAGGGSRHVGT